MRACSLFVFAVLVAVATKVLAEEVDFDKCGDYAFVPDSVDVSPYPPRSGSTLRVTIKGTSPVYVSGGKISYQVEIELLFFWISVTGGTENLCSYVKCPIREDEKINVVYSTHISSAAPPGRYRFKITLDDNKGTRLSCLKIEVRLKSSATENYQQLVLESDEEDTLPLNQDPHPIAV